jgi:hypothetical protein
MRILTIVFTATLCLGCTSAPEPISEKLKSELLTEADRGTVIGYVSHDSVYALNLSKSSMEKVQIDEGGRRKLMEEYLHSVPTDLSRVQSPSGEWVLTLEDKQFYLVNSKAGIKRNLSSKWNIVANSEWSPDSRFLLLTHKRSGVDREAVKCQSTAYSIVVYSVVEDSGGSIMEICEGFPYEGLHWLNLPGKPSKVAANRSPDTPITWVRQ